LVIPASLVYRGKFSERIKEYRTALRTAILSAFIYLGFGIWFWVATTIDSVRYFFPFAFMAIVCTVPLALEAVSNMSRRIKIALGVAAILPVINLALLLGQSKPSVIWQQFAGVNLTSGAYKMTVFHSIICL